MTTIIIATAVYTFVIPFTILILSITLFCALANDMKVCK